MIPNGTYLSVRVENLLKEFAETANPENFEVELPKMTMRMCELFYDELEYKYRLRVPKGK